MNSDRLLTLASLLERDAANPNGIRFDMESWGYSAESASAPAISCGTTACAIGLACLSPELEISFYVHEAKRLMVPYFEHRSGWEAVKHFFELRDIYDAEYLFDSRSYPVGETQGANSERIVAKRIREFIEARS